MATDGERERLDMLPTQCAGVALDLEEVSALADLGLGSWGPWPPYTNYKFYFTSAMFVYQQITGPVSAMLQQQHQGLAMIWMDQLSEFLDHIIIKYAYLDGLDSDLADVGCAYGGV